ncbi:MAG TPA: NADH-quinone oxidoreductase subunit M [Nitrospiraceae bacterium]|nr:NADH-quinone oxidoreductase subunit M [Nitrospiraceae bacterium]
MTDLPLLSAVVFLPLIGALALFLVKDGAARWLALAVSAADFFLSLPLWLEFDPSKTDMQFVERMDWISSPPIHYHLGLDGISLPLVLLTTLLIPLCVLVSWQSVTSRVREFMATLLIMETAMLGVFAALDFVLFYVFWEVMLIPMYLIIGIWGGPNRIYAAIKFFLYTLAGSVLLLVAILVLFFNGGHTFDIVLLSRIGYSRSLQFWLFWAFFIAFAVKVPMFPLHTWLPDAHVEAPTAGSVILASILLKMGAYGFLRFSLPMLPEAVERFTPIVLALSLVAILYGAYMALAQSDFKKLIAYSSVSHMGFVTLGIFVLNTQGVEGALLQMLNHGITTGGLFLCVGLIYERTHSRMIADNGGLSKPMPRYATCLVIFALSSLALPGTNSFISEFLVLVGSFLFNKAIAVTAALGVILAAVYLLWMVQRVAFGVPTEKTARVTDLNWCEMATLVPLIVLIFWIGVFPNPFLTPMHASVARTFDVMARGSQALPTTVGSLSTLPGGQP